MIQHQFTVSVSIGRGEDGIWRAEGENVALLMEADSRSDLVGLVVSAAQALGEWLAESKPHDQSLEDYCRSVGVECRDVEVEDGLEVAVRELREVMDEASRLLTVTQRIPARHVARSRAHA